MRRIFRPIFCVIFAVTAVAWGFHATAVAEPFQDGVAAYQRGDHAGAMRLFRSLADQGNGDAQYNVGVMYEKGLGVRTDVVAAADWYRKAANLGIVDAQCDLGILYAEGRGVPKDYGAAVGWFQKAAARGDARGQWQLGTMYYEGHGVTQNYADAMKWTRKAADQGLAEAQEYVGYMYATGKGVAKNPTEADQWYRRSADQGLASAQFKLGYRLATGEGMAPNPIEAEKWLKRAAEQNYPNAKTVLEVVQKALGDSPRDPAQSVPNRATNEPTPFNEQKKLGLAQGPTATAPAQQTSAINQTGPLNGDDLPRVVSTYSENEMRFKRDFLGRKFLDVLPFLSTKEKLFAKGAYTVSLGTGRVLGDIDCTVSSPAGVNEIANWNKGDKIHIEGIVRDVTFGSVYLDPCYLSK